MPPDHPWGFHGDSAASNAGGIGFIPGSERSLGGGNGNPLQCSCWENFIDRGVWGATVHGVAKSWTPLSMHTQEMVCDHPQRSHHRHSQLQAAPPSKQPPEELSFPTSILVGAVSSCHTSSFLEASSQLSMRSLSELILFRLKSQ